MSRSTARYAVYWVPEEDHPLWEAGCRWLGRDPRLDAAGTPPPLRSSPWRYGFHATLKAPMHLRDDASLDGFLQAAADLASQSRCLELPVLQVATLGDFVALRPSQETRGGDPLHELAARCVRELEAWRSPEVMSRNTASLDAEQRALLLRWGYPHVLERWRLHLTLSDSLDLSSPEADSLLHTARAHFSAALAHPLHLKSLCIFEEASRGAPLRLMARLTVA